MSFQDNYPLPELTINISLKGEMFSYQKPGTAFILKNKRVIVGDQMGLGKTLQTIAAIKGANAVPCLVVCPSSLKLNWEREIEQWSDLKPMVLTDPMKNTWQLFYQAGIANVFIVNYESLKKYFVVDVPTKKGWRLKDVRFNANINLFKAIVIDEGHRVKDPSAQQSKFARGIAYGKEYQILLTGTPVINSPSDLASQLAIINQVDKFGGYSHFMDYYDTKEESKLQELRDLLYSTCYYRREKSEVTDLPEKTRQVILCDITTQKEYDDAEKDLAEYLREYKNATEGEIKRKMRGEAMVRIGILKNISARGKIEAVTEFIQDTLSNGEKLIVFGHLREVLGELKHRFPGSVSVTGKDSTIDRQNNVDKFQNDPNTKLIFCSIAAAGVGITLTASSTVAFIEMGWHPAIMDQAEDRAHRIGQKNAVNCPYFIGKGTIDNWVYKIIEEKRGVANTVYGSEEDMEVEIVNGIMNLFSKKYNLNN